MARKGTSWTMRLVAIALIVITVAGIIIYFFSGKFGIVDSLLGGGLDKTEKDLAGEYCELSREKLCADGASGTQWATQSEFRGKTCQTWIQQGALGGNLEPC